MLSIRSILFSVSQVFNSDGEEHILRPHTLVLADGRKWGDKDEGEELSSKLSQKLDEILYSLEPLDGFQTWNDNPGVWGKPPKTIKILGKKVENNAYDYAVEGGEGTDWEVVVDYIDKDFEDEPDEEFDE